MSKNSTKIEQAAVNRITDAFFKSKRLTPYIPTNDKEPVWDGHIYIKHGNNGYSRIPTQVKGKCVKKLPKKTTFSVKIVNLENYKRDGGVIFFVVFITENERFPYFKFLAPIDIKRIIKNAKGNSETAITLVPLEIVEGDLENQFIQFYYDCKKQTSTASSDILTMEDAIQKGYSISYQVHGIDDELEAFRYATTHFTYLYANIENSGVKTLYPIGDQPYKLFFLPYNKKDVTCEGKKFFSEFQDGRNGERREIYIDNFLRMVRIKEQDKGKLEINLCQTNLERFFNQLSFVYAVSRAGNFWIGDEQVKIDKIEKTELADIESQYKFWEKVIATLQLLNVNISKIDISSFKDKDFRDLDMLRRAILDGEEICQPRDVSGITTVQIGPYRILVLVEKQKSGKYKITDFFKIREGKVFAVDKGDGHKSIVSFYSAVLQRDDLATLINIDYDNFIKAYEDAARFNRAISEQSNQDVLCLINAYDNAENKDERLLEYALKLTDWISNLPETDEVSFVYRLNKMQILKRMGAITEQERSELLDISESNIPAFGKWAANLLLEDYDRANLYWGKMSEEERKIYKNYPIFLFHKNRPKGAK